MTPLKNARHEAFAQARAKSMPAVAAYKLAGYNGDRSHASKLASNRLIMARVQQLQTAAASSVVLSIEEKRAFIARVIRSTPRQANMDNADCDMAVTKMGVVAILPSKAALIRLDNDLAPEVDSKAAFSVIVKIGGFDDGND